ncbi:phosphoribosyltransferase [Flavobacterium cauense R2A-7]|uniref:Putative phosphoribosyltransferase n=1 Tax=Flavobacterium cauense R2A-7 TaxID=1341154 RepID=V6SBL9_9FLAO|nr:phosphoribosyltransferase family protein [Flavobacterium cauense]ESU21785.1 phosphoribosyltransferase [Flavobacterium cauense R2A-7]KGO81017.1 phosphoribosyltransferase [Flavobacterium cauense R2A-7]TWI12932.1 putative phosphoribosyltransferase [Flavobacterium cauense R2A-7]
MESDVFANRTEAGKLLSEKLLRYKATDAVVLAIPRGGVPVGYEIAKRLQLPLGILLSKKIGHPANKEYAVGSVSLDSVIINEHIQLPEDYIENEIVRLRKVLLEKQLLYMGNAAFPDLEGKSVIVVDDGIATGSTVLVSIAMLRKKNAGKIIVAVPVVPSDNVEVFRQKADEFVFLIAPYYFEAVGAFYEVFNQVEDEEVIRLLNDAKHLY